MNREDILAEENINKRKRIHALEQLHKAGQNEINWESLPYPITVQVFSYLCDKDRVSVSQVCQKWNTCFKNPTLWRKRKFLIGGPTGEIQQNLYLILGTGYISFTSIFGSCLQDVKIVCNYNFEYLALTFIKLLENMKNARLQSFTLKHMMLDGNFCKYPELKLPVIKSINKMFQIQTELKKVKLENCEFDLVTGTEVLEHLAASSGRELQYLDQIESFDVNVRVNDCHPFQQTMKAFTNLSHISIDYSYICDELLLHWSVSLRHKLETMNVTTNDEQTQVVSKETWRKLSTSCPKLKVLFSVFRMSKATDIMRQLQPTIPLHAFSLDSYLENTLGEKLSVLLKYLVDCFQDRMEKVTLEIGKMQYSVDSELIYLLERCRLLKSFCLNTNVGDRVIHNICDLLRDSQSVLRTVKIALCGTNNIPEIRDTLRVIHDIMPED